MINVYYYWFKWNHMNNYRLSKKNFFDHMISNLNYYVSSLLINENLSSLLIYENLSSLLINENLSSLLINENLS